VEKEAASEETKDVGAPNQHEDTGHLYPDLLEDEEKFYGFV
jgi:hypothetical protein